MDARSQCPHEMDETFRAQRTRSTESHYEFDASTATVVYERWGCIQIGTSTSTCTVSVNLHGEYFCYMHAFQHTPIWLTSRAIEPRMLEWISLPSARVWE
jgi:hypothetical protein